MKLFLFGMQYGRGGEQTLKFVVDVDKARNFVKAFRDDDEKLCLKVAVKDPNLWHLAEMNFMGDESTKEDCFNSFLEVLDSGTRRAVIDAEEYLLGVGFSKEAAINAYMEANFDDIHSGWDGE